MVMAVFMAWFKSRSMGGTGTESRDHSVAKSRVGFLAVYRARSRMGPIARSVLYLWLCAMPGSSPVSVGWFKEVLV